MHKCLLSCLLAIGLISCASPKTDSNKLGEVYKSADQQATLEVINESHPSMDKLIKGKKIALLLPLSGKDVKIGKNLFDASQQAVSDLKFNSMHIIPVDSSIHTDRITAQLDHIKPDIILGPVFAEDVKRLYPYAQRKQLCMVVFSNDHTLKGQGCLMLLGVMAYESVNRTLEYATSHGYTDIRAILPINRYGNAIVEQLPSKIKVTYYGPKENKNSQKEFAAAITNITDNSAILIPEGGDNLARIIDNAGLSKLGIPIKLLGSSLWEDDRILKNPALKDAWFASLSNKNRQIFEQKFTRNFGYKPMKIATLGYDGIALLASLTDQSRFDKKSLTDPSGFMGISGAFRFRTDGSNERMLSVYEISDGIAREISPALESFQ